MKASSSKWWVVGLAGAILWPVLLLAGVGMQHHLSPVQTYQPYFDALAFSFAGSLGAIAVPVLPVRPWLRLALFFLYVPLFLYAVSRFAPWVW
jgi:hypothetical protein